MLRDARQRLLQPSTGSGSNTPQAPSRNALSAVPSDGSLSFLDVAQSSRSPSVTGVTIFGASADRVISGDFNVQRDKAAGNTTGSFTGRVAWENMVGETTMVGYYVGANATYSNISGAYDGRQVGYGLNTGAYFVTALQENVFLDGFASVGAGRNNLELADSTVDLQGDYTYYTAAIGTSLSAVIDRGSYEIRPEMALTYGYTHLGSIGMTDRNAGVVGNQTVVDAGSVSIANLTIRPEFRVPLDGLAIADSRSVFSFAPRGICERVSNGTTTQGCGGGIELGLSSTSEDGLAQFNARVSADRIADTTRTALNVGFQYQF